MCDLSLSTRQISLFAPGAVSAKVIRQREIISKCIRSGERLADALARVGWTYDDLRYERSGKSRGPMKDVPTLEEFRKPGRGVRVTSFFAGAGGLDLGFEAAGFTHTALVEKVPLFCETLRANRKTWNVLGPPDAEGDVSNIDNVIAGLEPIVGKPKFDGVFAGGPPCQPFSIAANQRFSKTGENFKRVGFAHEVNGNLLFDYIEIAKHFRPAVLLIENVPGLIDLDGGEQLQRAYRDLENHGYTVHQPLALLAGNYSVPQSRTRLFIVANRLGKHFRAPAPSSQMLACGGAFRRPVAGVANHVTREHSAESIRRYSVLDYGERDQLGRVDRLDPWQPSKTVIAGGTRGGGRSHLHPTIPRTLSARESARLQTFPDEYVFAGPTARQFTQVGNAVPPILAAQLADAIYNSFFR